MDFLTHALRLPGFRSLSLRVPKLSAPTLDFSGFKRFVKPALGVTLIMTSLVLGALAYSASKKDALDTWEHAYIPAARIIEHALGASGYSRLKNPESLQRVMRTLPLQTDENGSFWWGNQGDWIIVITTGDSGSTPGIYYRPLSDGHEPAIPKLWSRVGAGWPGFQGTLDRATQLPPRPSLIRTPARRVAPSDPLLLQY